MTESATSNVVELRRTAGRPKGSRNKTTAQVREIAQRYGQRAVKTLAKIMRDGENDTVKMKAASEILDRAYGKAPVDVTTRQGGLLDGIVSLIAGVGDAAADESRRAGGGASQPQEIVGSNGPCLTTQNPLPPLPENPPAQNPPRAPAQNPPRAPENFPAENSALPPLTNSDEGNPR